MTLQVSIYFECNIKCHSTVEIAVKYSTRALVC